MDTLSSGSSTALAEPITEQDHAIGPPRAPIAIVEYGDYECPDILNAVPIVRNVRKLMGNRVRFVFRHFPQSSIHPHASAAAEAAEAAADQGKFWEMHEALFKHQKELADLGHLALNLGLEIYQFESSRTEDRHRKRIRADYESGVRSGVKKTPTFFINGRKYDGPIKAQAIVNAASEAAP